MLWRTFFQSRNTQARLTIRRFFIMTGFFPLLFVIQTIHWMGFILDEILFRKYKAVKVKSPLFIVGVPRSGTTFLHRLIANDSDRFTTLSLWELILAPSVTEKKFWLGLGRIDKFLGGPGAHLVQWVERRMLGSLDNIHRISLSAPEEDYFVLVPIYACFILILPFPFADEPGYLAFFDKQTSAADKQRIMKFYKSCLQRHLYVNGTKKLILSKNVSFTPMIETLIRFFPDSRIIGTVRNPLKAVPSHISSMMKGAAIFDNDTSGHEFRNQMLGVQHYAYTHLMEILPNLPEDRQMIIRMEDLQAKLYPLVQKIYDRFGHEMSPLFKAFIEHQEQRQKRYKSTHTYDIDGCGLTETMIYERFSDVFDKFEYAQPGCACEPEYRSSRDAVGKLIKPL